MSAPLDRDLESRIRAASKRRWSQRIVDWLFGYDYFISYRWSDGRSYAVALAEALKKDGFDCFLDSEEYLKGENWKAAGEMAIRKTSRLVLVGSPEVHQSQPVLRELRVFTASGKRVIPINFAGSLSPQKAGDSPLWQFLDRDGLWIEEALERLREGPSAATVQALKDSFQLERQRHKRLRLFRVFFGVLLLLAISAIVALGWVIHSLPETRLAEAKTALEAGGLAVQRTDVGGVPHFEVSSTPGTAITDWHSAGSQFDVLERYGKVRSVNLGQSGIGDLTPLASLRSVESLDLWAARLTDLTSVQHLTAMKTLVLSQNPALDDDDLACLSGMSKLATLKLFGCRSITDDGLGYLVGLPLEVLWLDSCNRLSMDGIVKLNRPPLRELRLRGTSMTIDKELLEFVRECPNLKELSVDPERADAQSLSELRRICAERRIKLDDKPSGKWDT